MACSVTDSIQLSVFATVSANSRVKQWPDGTEVKALGDVSCKTISTTLCVCVHEEVIAETERLFCGLRRIILFGKVGIYSSRTKCIELTVDYVEK